MMEDLYELLLRFPGACRTLGSTLYSVAGLALICGAYAQVGTTAASAASVMAGQPPVTQAADLLLGMWTWWVPESFPGFSFYLALGAAGALLAATAKKVQRHLRRQPR